MISRLPSAQPESAPASAQPASIPEDIFYPDSDGQPMSDNTKQFRWIVLIQQNLASLFAADPNVFYDPDKNDLSGWLRQAERLEVIDPIAQWVSPRLRIRFELASPELQLYRPDGEPFTTLEQEQQRAEQERQRAEQERQRAEQAEQRAARLAEQLRAAGIDDFGD
jgi:hypothetical protein